MTATAERLNYLRRLKKEVYREYGYAYYVPMAEAYTVQIPVTVGCSYDKCLYCRLNQGMKFRELTLDEISGYISKLRVVNEGKKPGRFLLVGGNPFVLGTEKLLRIADVVRENFPECEYISAFSRADDITRKSPAELRTLHEAGYNRLCIGVESGSDDVLAFQNKGVTRAGILQAMNMLDNAGMNYSTYIMLGLGGHDMSDSHIHETASLLNMSHPFSLTVVTLVIFRGAGLIDRIKSHEFHRMHPFDALKEGRKLLSLLEIPTIWDATHKTNIFPIKGKLPEHKEKLLRRIDDVIAEIEAADIKQYELKRWREFSTE